LTNADIRAVSVFGLGYVGSVTAACLSSKGFDVIGVDVNSTKVDMLGSGRSPIIETGIDELIAEGHKTCRLRATTDSAAAVGNSDISFVCVGTPSLANGKQDLIHLKQVCKEIGLALAQKTSYHIVVLRSTVIPGTTSRVVIPVLEQFSGKRAGVDFAVCFNPEFTREGCAVADFFEPPYTILGGDESESVAIVRHLYAWALAPVFETSLAAAEAAKYASNAFHAVKVTFANEIGTLFRELSVDIEAVMRMFVADHSLNISSAYLSPGFAFGGSCLPKDLRALSHEARELNLHLPLLEGVLPSNNEHVSRAADLILNTKKRNVGLLGLSFKAGTDDLRESPHVQLTKRLLGEGLRIRIWDPQVSLGRLVGSNRHFIEDTIPHIGMLLTPDLKSALETAEVVVIGTKSVTTAELAAYLRPEQIVVDLVNFKKPQKTESVNQYTDKSSGSSAGSSLVCEDLLI
jgi:GDP-mannose 6-dehydrogenase